MIAWDQLALFRVTVGDGIEGYRILFDDDVRFVLIGGTEIVPSTILRMFVLHVVGALLLAAVVTSFWWSRRRSGEVRRSVVEGQEYGRRNRAVG